MVRRGSGIGFALGQKAQRKFGVEVVKAWRVDFYLIVRDVVIESREKSPRYDCDGRMGSVRPANAGRAGSVADRRAVVEAGIVATDRGTVQNRGACEESEQAVSVYIAYVSKSW